MESSIKYPQDTSLKEILVTLALGLLIGFVITLLFKALEWIEIQHLVLNEKQIPFHLVALPFVLVALAEIKKRTLYFPTKVSEITATQVSLPHHWSPWMTVFHLLGNTISHFVGASVGREGTAVMMSAGLVRALRLSWTYWGVIAMTIGFSAVVGQPLIALIFITELFSTSLKQKLYALIGSMTAYLLMKTLGAPHLFSTEQIHHTPPVSLL